ncbi:class IV lanthionine synthetase LanL [Nonomuraea sp. NPDC049480]|uniref:class IV lanthionine synthetase LanL n=1 Tax=Nonomuraea sp. NPDC049480 TaxID=3364353 RepID=UPI003790E484
MSERGDTILGDIVAAVLGDGWSVADHGFWRSAAPEGGSLPVQGWKLHVSATMLSAPVVLSRVARVLVREGCAFKFPATLDGYWELCSPRCDRAQAGKLVTAYPEDDRESARLAALLDAATRGLPGPAILSDRPYRPGGIVHYRYGAFDGIRVLGGDGFYEVRLRSPDGEPVRDERLPRFTPPPFATSPFAEEPVRPSAGAVLLNGRYVVREAIRHGNRGGVYLARDDRTGHELVIKEGRPHACADLSGADARDKLAAERDRLEALAGTGAAPAVVDFFEQGGHVFLAEERVPGTTLERWSERTAGPLGRDGFGGAARDVLPVARELVRKVAAAHGRGLVLMDLAPGNVMIGPDGDLRLIDLEFAAGPGDTVLVGGTPGFLAPELVPYRGLHRAAPEPSADLYSLGAMLFFLATGGARPEAREGAPAERAVAYARRVRAGNPTLALLWPVVEGLLAEPGKRWSLDRCAAFLDHLTPPATPDTAAEAAAPVNAALPSGVGVDELVADGLAWLAGTMDRGEDAPSLWDSRVHGAEADPCAVAHGAAGVLTVLATAARVTAFQGTLTGIVAGWLRRRLEREAVWPPGLHMGRSGAVWALHDAATTPQDRAAALRAARELPTRHPRTDITHGLAGCGMAVLRLALLSGDTGLRAQAEATFDHLHVARSHPDGHPRWPTHTTGDPAGHLGFAHGVAGIATALLYAATALDRPDWMPAVHEVAALLRERAELDGDTAWWPTLRSDPATVRPRRPHWCSGSSGIGSFLVRYWRATGDEAALSLAGQAAAAAHRSRWRIGTAACHGLPGEGDFLLDMAAFTGEARYRRWAEDVAACLVSRAAEEDGRLLVPDPFGAFVPGYLGGVAGVLAFLLRLRHGHARLWMLDDVVPAHELVAVS